MKKIYFAGKFNKIKKQGITLDKSLVNDYRSQLLGCSKLLTYCQDNLIVNNKYQYSGPFYCEQASNGNFTSTDCTEVLNAEYKFIEDSDVFVAVLGERFSVGTIVELGWAIEKEKQIILLYQEEKSNFQSAIKAYVIGKAKEKLVEELKKQEELDLFNNIEMPVAQILAEMQWEGGNNE